MNTLKNHGDQIPMQDVASVFVPAFQDAANSCFYREKTK